MKAIIKKPVEIDIHSVIIDLPVRYEDEDIPYDFPLREGDEWRAEVLIDSGRILNWTEGYESQLHIKVCDEGVYTLRDSSGEDIAVINDYVPHGVVPGDYGDYVVLDIGADGVIKNWPKKPCVESFFKSSDDE